MLNFKWRKLLVFSLSFLFFYLPILIINPNRDYYQMLVKIELPFGWFYLLLIIYCVFISLLIMRIWFQKTKHSNLALKIYFLVNYFSIILFNVFLFRTKSHTFSYLSSLGLLLSVILIMMEASYLYNNQIKVNSKRKKSKIGKKQDLSIDNNQEIEHHQQIDHDQFVNDGKRFILINLLVIAPCILISLYLSIFAITSYFWN